MCGIVGFSGNGIPAEDGHAILQRMCGVIHHRGPDGEGIYYRKPIGLGMRRLSIIDLDTGQQPISNEDDSVKIVFNGEIYNYRSVRETLISKGHRFTTKSDTEVIVHAYEEYGKDCIFHLRGMFAFAIWDEKNQRLFLARDRMGIKPLFYTISENTLMFASEIKSLLAGWHFNRSISAEAVNTYFTFGYIPDPLTIFNEVRQLPPGSILTWENEQFEIEKYWKPHALCDTKYRSLMEWKEDLLFQLDQSVKLHLESDVPLGVFLSGGVDSSAILGLMAKHSNRQIKTFSIGFEGNAFYDERPYAKQVARQFNADHQEFIVRPDVQGILPLILSAFDQPFADSSVIPNFYVSQMTSQKVKVALSGLGGDELFGGYERYLGTQWGETYQRIPSWIRNFFILPLVSSLPDSSNRSLTLYRAKRFVRNAELSGPSRYLGIISFYSLEERLKLLQTEYLMNFKPEAVEIKSRELFGNDSSSLLNRMLFFDQNQYLPGDLLTLTDRISMAHSLEVRVPFLDHVFLEFAMAIPPEFKIHGSEKKYILKEALSGVLPKNILNRRKKGFSVPLAQWLREDLKELVLDVLGNGNSGEIPFINWEMVRKILKDHLSRKRNYENQLWSLLIFVLWFKKNQISQSL